MNPVACNSEPQPSQTLWKYFKKLFLNKQTDTKIVKLAVGKTILQYWRDTKKQEKDFTLRLFHNLF